MVGNNMEREYRCINHAMRRLHDLNIPLPDPPTVEEKDGVFPRDFTKCSSEELMSIYSRLKNYIAFGKYECSLVNARETALEEEIKDSKTAYIISQPDAHKAGKITEVKERALIQDNVIALRVQLMEVVALHGVLTALVEGWEGLSQAASRELTRRTSTEL